MSRDYYTGVIFELEVIREGLKVGNGFGEMLCWNQGYDFNLEFFIQILGIRGIVCIYQRDIVYLG